MGGFENSVSIVTTHYNYLHKLEKDTKKFKNYKMESIIKNDTIEFPYKIKKGYSKQYIALELLKNNKNLQKNKDIFEEAIKFKNNLFKKSLKNTKPK